MQKKLKTAIKPRKTVPIGITLPKELLPRLQRIAFESGRSVSGYIAYLVRQNLEGMLK